jgi:hypothetical protein
MLDKEEADQNAPAPGAAVTVETVAQQNQATITNLREVSKCIINEPIRNAANPPRVSFYLNFDEYKITAPHYYHIQAESDTPLVQYRTIDYTGPTGPTDDAHVIRANTFTYIDVTMDRIADKTYQIYPYTVPLNLTQWNPPAVDFPRGFIT